MKKLLPLFLIFLLAFFLRAIFVFTYSISFHYDMARDAFAAREIWQDHHLKILGPPSSLAGLYHGVLYYYLIAPFYGLGNGDPRFPVIAISLLNSLTIIPIFLLAKRLFKKKKWAILSSFLFSVSFESAQYGTWLSNPAPAVFFVAFFFYGLYLWLEDDKWGLPLAVFSAAIATQFQFFLVYLFFLLPVFLYIFKPKIKPKPLLFSIILGTLGLASFFISMIKFNTYGQTISTLYSLSKSKGVVSGLPFSSLILNYVDRLASLFSGNFFPSNLFIGGMIGFFAFYFARKNRFIIFSLISALPLFVLGGHNSGYTNLGLITPSIIAIAFLIKEVYRYDKRLSYLLIIVITISNLFIFPKNFAKGQTALVIPKGMLLSNQLRLIDKTYEIAEGKPFTINSLTLPLWTNTTWAYLYSWYGQNKYGYKPQFYGRDQIGMPGELGVERIVRPSSLSFFIMEPGMGIPSGLFSQEIEAENSRTRLLREFDYGELKLQVREPLL